MLHSTTSLPLFLWRHYSNLMCLCALLIMHAMFATMPLFSGTVPLLMACVVGFSAMHGLPMASTALVLLGIGHDVASGLPLGITVLQLVGLYGGLTRYQDAIEDMGFMTRYLWVGLGITACFLLQYIATSFVMHMWMPIGGLVVPWIITVLFYPLTHIVLRWVQQRLYRRTWVFLPLEYKPVP